ncbi:Virulence plasmid protein B [Tenacibaculum xiamenense]
MYVWLMLGVLAVPTFAEEVPDTPIETETTAEVVEETPTTEEPEVQNTVLYDAVMSLFAAPVAEPEPPKPVKIDALNSLKGVQGTFDVSLFTGAATYHYPMALPEGRNGMTPQLALAYNSNYQKFDGMAGYGWEIPESAIFRSTERGVDKLYSRNDFSATIEGQYAELLVVDDATGQYGAKREENFVKYVFSNNTWTAWDKAGTQYTFDVTQVDPDDATKVYKWLLSEKKDRYGNTITYTYYQEGGQVYPETIRYTNNGSDLGIYEVKFARMARPDYATYARGFKTVAKYNIDAIEVWTHHSGTPELITTYDLGYTAVNNAVQLLTSITQKAGGVSLPATEFEYYDGTENTPHKKRHYMKTITNSSGGVHQLEYKYSSAYRKPNGDTTNWLSFPVYTLHKVGQKATSTEPMYTTTYTYEGGHSYYDNLDAYKKEYAGFHTVTVVDASGNKQKVYFHQSENAPDNTTSSTQGEFEDHIAKKGKMYREESLDANDTLYQAKIYKWEKSALADVNPDKDRYFVFMSRSVIADYDGQSTPRATAKTYNYDSYGNTTQEIDYGEVILTNTSGEFTDTLQDKIITNTTYAVNSGAYMYEYPSSIEQLDINSTMIGKTELFYDALSIGNIGTGSLTQMDEYTSGNTKITKKYEYNSVGLPTKFIDGRGFSTTLTYGSHNLYPVTITNAKNHTTSMEYDMRFGQAESITDANGMIHHIERDTFGRVIAEQYSSLSDVNILETHKTYSYDLVNKPVSVTQNINLQSGIDVEQKTYLDGFDRTIQTRTETEGANKYIVSNTIYDERGNVKKSILPFESTGNTFETINQNAIGTTMVYDPMNREIQITNPMGSTHVIYNKELKATTDAEGNRKDIITDVRGNITEVKEYLDGTAHSTVYTYNPLSQMTKMTDSQGNQKLMTYDLLGRKLSETHWHKVGDTTFGTDSFVYDANGNITQKTNAKNEQVNYAYDELNRITVENYIGQNGIEASHSYDSGTYGIGRLAQTVTPAVTKSYKYNVLGRITENKKTIDGQDFVLGFTYDKAGNPITITYPDTTVVTNTYNNAGQIETVVAGSEDVITNVDYNPLGSITKINFANGIETNNTYLAIKMYRLTEKNTTDGISNLQNLAYGYDSVGNITQIVDSSNTDTAKTTNYTYDDLYRLTQVAVTGSANSNDYTRNYTYDSIGNMLTRSDVGTYTYAGNNAGSASGTNATPHAVTDVVGTAYTYDDNGNLTSNGTWTHSWNYNDTLSSSTDETTTVNYYYDELKDRVKKDNQTSGKTTYYIDKYYDLEDTTGKVHMYIKDAKVATKTNN